MLPTLARRSTAQGGAWTTETPMPTARSAFSVGEVNGVLYAVGGSTARPYVQPLPDSTSGVVEAYDPTNDSWTAKTSKMNGGQACDIAIPGSHSDLDRHYGSGNDFRIAESQPDPDLLGQTRTRGAFV
jgi:hypothetical protein